ncbi:CDP-alcohol phosphatidyltransferase family protein [Aureispira sp. CCB-E]|uniref:CDP-alcohol phosphatidyltransferase family protein n=1 Tax=Aureispira sp. CCB-E TaxID=3051121 RepID=UPI002868492F|nr:CDP-alcohol phosphatidyltransferase family protein [Aureispira sp. CCB-E]WMX13261.1 CDP-alcohol phosphatidyltransferase family protein [Aureispira sp. CCB-E]
MIKKHIPNTVTLSNLLCGCLALISIFTNQLEMVPFFIAVSLLADYFDGLLARLLKVNSPMGRELDSLADMVSFGVVPGAMLYYLINQANGIAGIDFGDTSTLVGLVGFLVTLFSCIRLAKFNLDTRQTEGFVGLNTPACTIFVLGLLLITLGNLYGMRNVVLNEVFLYSISAILSYLLIAEIPMFSFKFKSLELKGNKIRVSFIVVSILCFCLFKFGAALSLIILFYILISIVLWMGGMLKREKREF